MTGAVHVAWPLAGATFLRILLQADQIVRGAATLGHARLCMP
jgi:uncharacterized membrane protein HdeD (DUF308 family)